MISIVSATLLAAGLVSSTDAPPSSIANALLAVGAVGALRMMRRQWILSRIGGGRASATALAGIGFVALAATLASDAEPGSAIAWLVLVTENTGVLAAGVAILVGYRLDRSVADVLAPLASREPLAALEIGLAPEVHAFVAALQRNDTITRDHVVRSSALALRVALRAGLRPERAREVALGALLHDIGKLLVPSET